MTKIRDAIFPKIERNINFAQQKQKQQYLKRTGGLKFTFNNGDAVLRRNMLQKTSKGHKMEDQWLGPCTVEGLDLVNGTCKLRAKDGKLLQRKINLKDPKLYSEQSTSQKPSNDALLQAPSAQQHPTLPQTVYISAVPQNNQSRGSSVWQPTQSTSHSKTSPINESTERSRGATTCPNTNNKSALWISHSKASPINESTERSRGATTCTNTNNKSALWTSHSKTSAINESVGRSRGAKTCLNTNNKSGRWTSHSKTSPINKSSERSRAATTCPNTNNKSAGWASHSKASSINESKRGAGVQQLVQRPAPSTYDPRGGGVAEPAPNTNESIGAAISQPSSTSSNQGEEAVQQALLLGNLHGARDFRSLSNKLKAITEQDIIVSFNEVILGVLSSILDGTNNSWRYNVYCRKTSLEGVETIDRDDLKFNVTFGDFDENQAYAMLQLIAKHFPKLPSTCQTEVLLPEALVHLCCHRLDMTYDQAETFLSLSGEEELGDSMAHLKNKVDNKTKKKRNNFGKKRKNCAQDGEVEFIKRFKTDELAILKMQGPKFNLEPEHSAISKTAMLTERHI